MPWLFDDGWGSILVVSTGASARATAQFQAQVEAGIVPIEMPWWHFEVPRRSYQLQVFGVWSMRISVLGLQQCFNFIHVLTKSVFEDLIE